MDVCDVLNDGWLNEWESDGWRKGKRCECEGLNDVKVGFWMVRDDVLSVRDDVWVILEMREVIKKCVMLKVVFSGKDKVKIMLYKWMGLLFASEEGEALDVLARSSSYLSGRGEMKEFNVYDVIEECDELFWMIFFVVVREMVGDKFLG